MIGDSSVEGGDPVIPVEVQAPAKTDALSQTLKDARKTLSENQTTLDIAEVRLSQDGHTDSSEEDAKAIRKEKERQRLIDINSKLVEITGRDDLKAFLKELGATTGSDVITLLNGSWNLFSSINPRPMLQINSNGDIYALTYSSGDPELTKYKRVDVASTPHDENGNEYLTSTARTDFPFLSGSVSFYEPSERGYNPLIDVIDSWGSEGYQSLTAEKLDMTVQDQVKEITQAITAPPK